MRSFVHSSGVALALGLVLLSCAGRRGIGTSPDSKPDSPVVSHVELTIGPLNPVQAESIKRQLESKDGIQDVVIKRNQGGIITYELDVHGCECELPAMIAGISTPGLRYEGRSTHIRYATFDNTPPTLLILFPEAGEELAESDPIVAVDVPDQDVKEVRVNGVAAQRFRGSIYRAPIRLKQGAQVIEAVATDHSGNTGRTQVEVEVDLDPQTRVKTTVEGKVEVGAGVLVQGREAPADAQGRYRREITVRKGQRQVGVISVGADGAKTVTVKGIAD